MASLMTNKVIKRFFSGSKTGVFSNWLPTFQNSGLQGFN